MVGRLEEQRGYWILLRRQTRGRKSRDRRLRTGVSVKMQGGKNSALLLRRHKLQREKQLCCCFLVVGVSVYILQTCVVLGVGRRITVCLARCEVKQLKLPAKSVEASNARSMRSLWQRPRIVCTEGQGPESRVLTQGHAATTLNEKQNTHEHQCIHITPNDAGS